MLQFASTLSSTYPAADLHAEQPRMVETQGDRQAPPFEFQFGPPPPRLVLATNDGRCIVQLQRDRLVVNIVRPDGDAPKPSWSDVRPKLENLLGELGSLFPRFDAQSTDLVELTYVDRIPPADGIWQTLDEIGSVITFAHAFEAPPTVGRLARIGAEVVFDVVEGDAFRGRMIVTAEPSSDEHGQPVIYLRNVARRTVAAGDPLNELDICHERLIDLFVAATTEELRVSGWGQERP